MSESQPASDVAVSDSTAERTQLAVAGFYNPDMDFRKLALEAQYHARGFRLVSKAELIGVPHVIVGVTYREGFPRNGKVGDYVSVEAVVADMDTLNSIPVRSQIPQELTVFGNEPVVYNDSGTGIRRELTKVFQEAGLIDVGPPNGDEDQYDKPYQFWTAGEELAGTGIVADGNGVKFRYLALRGLRRSDYESPYGPATTYYFG